MVEGGGRRERIGDLLDVLIIFRVVRVEGLNWGSWHGLFRKTGIGVGLEVLVEESVMEITSHACSSMSIPIQIIWNGARRIYRGFLQLSC